jgi:acyl carrier protein
VTASSWKSEPSDANNEELVGNIRAIFATKWAIQVESPLLDLLDTGLVDSVTLVELLLELEDRFGVSLPLEELELEDFRTVARIAALVTRTRPAPPPAVVLPPGHVGPMAVQEAASTAAA